MPPAALTAQSDNGDMSVLLHITTRAEWEAALAQGAYCPPSLEREGFIHLSAPSQVAGTANRFFGGQSDLVLLTIDPANLESSVRWEDTSGHGQFPHLYGPLNPDAVTAVRVFAADADGHFRFHFEEDPTLRA